MSGDRLTFCTTCKGRLHHLKKTLPSNLKAGEAFSNVDFVLLNYDSPDELHDWTRESLSEPIGESRLVYYRLAGSRPFHMSHAKNVAHLLARGDVLCNLDADNYVDSAFIEASLKLFACENDVVTHGRRCAWGRIALRKTDFMKVGGYEEALEGWGCEDQDLLARCRVLLQRRTIRMSKYDRFIRHGDSERTQYIRTKSLQESRNRNKALLRRLRGSTSSVANLEKCWGEAVVMRNFDGKSMRVCAGPACNAALHADESAPPAGESDGRCR